jgi:hypothetical protein
MTAALPAGVTGNSGLNVNDMMVQFLTLLRGEVPDAIPLHITSGVRGYAAQASALVTKRRRAKAARAAGKNPGTDDLRQLYRRGNGPKIVSALLNVPNTVSAMAAVLQRFGEQGIFLSRHMRGDALDIRKRRGAVWFSAAEVATIMEAAKRLGARALNESDHIHVEGLKPGLLASLRATQATVAQTVAGKAEEKLPPAKRKKGKWARQAAIAKRRSTLSTRIALGIGGSLVLFLLGFGVWALRKRRR